MPVQAVLRGNESSHCPIWGDNESQAQGRQHAFGKRADVENDVRRVSGSERFEGTAFVAKFAIVVILDDDRPMLAGELHQPLTAAPRQRYAEGQLLRRID